jgi:hypothetical protein
MADPIAIESPQTNINRARFVGRDFFTFLDDIIARIQALFVTEFNDFVVSGTGQMLIDIVAWACETLSFYIDRQASESYLATARTRKGISRLARQLGYKMSAAVAATVDLEVNLAAIQPFGVTIPVGFKFKGPKGLVYEAVEAVTFPTGEGPDSPSRTVGVREGETRVEIFTSNGAKNQSFRLNPQKGRFIAGSGFLCRVAGTPWNESDILTFDPTNQFEVNYNDVPPTLRFGNGVAGNIPAVGAEVRSEYVATSGKAGAAQSDTINDVVSPLVVAATIIPLTITNPLPTTPGADQEDLDRTRTTAPGYYKARDVAVTREDYEGLSLAYVDALAGAVAVAQAFVAHSAEDDIQLQIYLDNIRSIVSSLAADVKDATDQIASDKAAIYELRDTADDATVVIATKKIGIEGDADDAITAARSIKNRTSQIGVDVDDIKGHVVIGKAFVNAIPTSVPDQLTTNSRDTILAYFDLIDAEANNISGDASAADGEAGTVVDKQASIKTKADELEEENTAAQTSLDDMEPLLDSIEAQVIVINNRVNTGFETAIETELQNIFDHVDGFLSDDCKANLVQVPILTRDVDGFLIEPPIALIRSLYGYLDARKEVTHVVEVVSGGAYLVPAVITGTIGVLPGYVRQTVLSNVQKAVDDLLRVRDFGVSLRTSDLDAITSPNPQTGVGGISGVKYSVFRILGSLEDPADPTSIITDFWDDDHNLIITSKYVITKGLVTLTGEEAAA